MKFRASIFGLLTIVVVVAATLLSVLLQNNKVPELIRSVAIDPPQPLASVNLIDHSNHRVDLARFTNNWTFIFFGFTSCPHVCPATLSQLGVLKKAIVAVPEYGNNLQVFFISVDPERDTVQRLAEYMRHFDPQFIGMTGDEAAVLGFEKQLSAYHRIGEKDQQNGYDVDHSGEVYLIDPSGRLTAKFEPPLDPAQVVVQFYQFVVRYTQASA